VDRQLVIYRRVRREYRGASVDRVSPLGGDPDPVVAFVMADIGSVGVEAAAARDDRPGKSGEVFRRVEPALVREAKRPAGVDAGDRRTLCPFDIDQDLSAGGVFLFYLRAMARFRRKEEPVHPCEIGVDALLSANRLGPVDCRDLTLVVETRLILVAGLVAL
jgi:hypothetical protein